MRFISWNMQHKRASWHFLHERHGDADAALLQEHAPRPARSDPGWMSGPALDSQGLERRTRFGRGIGTGEDGTGVGF